MRNAGLEEAQAGIKIAGRNIDNLICRWYHPYGRKWRRTKEPLDKSEKVGLKLNIQKTKIMASGPITSWQIDGETVSDFVFWGSKITADGDCSHEIKRLLLLGRKIMTNLDSIQKSRDITLPTKLVKARRSCMDVKVVLWRKLSAIELVLLNCGVGEDSWESLGLQGVPISISWRKLVLNVHGKDWCWS